MPARVLIMAYQDPKIFGKKLRELAKNRFGTITNFAAAIGMSQSQLSQLICGTKPTLPFFLKLASLNIDVNALLDISPVPVANAAGNTSYKRGADFHFDMVVSNFDKFLSGACKISRSKSHREFTDLCERAVFLSVYFKVLAVQIREMEKQNAITS